MPTSIRSLVVGPRRALCRLAACAVVLGPLVGCVQVHEQRLLAKRNMQFSRSAVFSYSSKLMPQVQPGLGATGQAKASACTACN